MDHIIENITRLENSELFKEWEKGHRGAHLCGVFMMCKVDEVDNGVWQIDFLLKNRITSFIMENDIKMIDAQELFNKDSKINELDIKKVKVPLHNAISLATKVIKEKYSNESLEKIIIVLQNYLWNITYVTSSFSILNFRISTSDGKIIEDKLTPLL